MRDAMRMSIDYLKENGKRDKKVLVVVTDGDDNNSSGTLEDLIKDAQQGEVLIYTVGLLAEDEKREVKRTTPALNAISKATGGKSYYSTKLRDVAGACQQAAHDIRSQYVIEYQCGSGWLIPADQGSSQRAEPTDRTHPIRLLRHA